MREKERVFTETQLPVNNIYIQQFFYRISNKGKKIINILHDNLLKTVV